jgi:hypothetical protein
MSQWRLVIANGGILPGFQMFVRFGGISLTLDHQIKL